MILVTGGAGFVGSHFILDWLATSDEPVVNVDALTYAGNLQNLDSVAGDARHRFVHGDIVDSELIASLLARHRPRAIVNLAAESHVDRSIRTPGDFVRTNVEGTFRLLEAARRHWLGLSETERAGFRFLQVSTDEVYGSLAPGAAPFAESQPQAPNSPYAASKAAADHLVRAWHQTYGLPVLTTHCGNNFGPRHFPEKLIPLALGRALERRPIPLYGDGEQVRDWIHVGDHCSALRLILAQGRVGEVYNIGAGLERSNRQVVGSLCGLLDELRPHPAGPYAGLITPAPDRPGHDRRYGVDAGKLRRELGWRAHHGFESGLRETVAWYLQNPDWLQARLDRPTAPAA
ncbi:MAG: dTDP-glucose 4,6-dehydratase [Rubrivivax sp.]|nr:dTDP-glucose 4,6-dehydratase [Rubrivivax sp.]